ncbi:MAG: hypothetical protein JNM65_03115 [Verrucomicrobiaceae bacterium]|nr:hypothetical protein [Verrucomicrobiaceae bacterium]
MRFPHAFLLFCVPLLFASCGEPQADVASHRVYEKGRLTFQYPGNWKIGEDQNLEGILHLTVETSGDAIVIVQLYPSKLGQPLEEFAREFAKVAGEELPIGKVTGSKFTPLEKSGGFDVLQEDFTLQLLGEKIPHVRRYFSRGFTGGCCFLICQVAVEDFGKVEAGFKQVAASLKVKESPAADAGAP